MVNLKTVHFIGCGVLAPEVKYIADEKGLKLKMNFLPGGLHDKPDELRIRLQEAIDQAAQDPYCDRIVVGYGVCGTGTIGIQAPHVPLVFPKVHDCIALFLGSDQAYKCEFARYPGTFYISAGWYTEKKLSIKNKPETIWIGDEALGCQALTDKYGNDNAEKIINFFNSWHKNYQRAAFIDTGIGMAEKCANHARDMAEKHNWKYESIPGDLSLLTKLLTQDYSDKEILIVSPSYCTIFSALNNSLDSAPYMKNALPGNPKPRFLAYDSEDNITLLSDNVLDVDGESLSDTLVHGFQYQKKEARMQNPLTGNAEPRSMVYGDEKNRELSIEYGLGIDAGGTYTDALIYDFNKKEIFDKNKALTTKWDFSIGIDTVLSNFDSTVLKKIELVSVSTTLATNAIVEGEGQKTGLILMSSGGNVDGKLISHNPRCNVKGHINISGKEIQPVDEDEVRRAVRQMVDQDGVSAFAVSGFGGAVNPTHELIVKQIIREETGMVVCCGHELSDLLNFIVRAQTAVLNVRIIPRMIKFFHELDEVLKKRGINAPIMVVKGDGTLMSSAMAQERPVETMLSGPAASVAGARLLTGLDEAMVVDMGGTTTDTADICEGEVKVCGSGANVGGFITHVKALDMRTVGLGGDSLIQWNRDNGGFTIGPRRVGPIVWANASHPEGIGDALQYMKRHKQTRLTQTILVAMEGDLSFNPTDQEKKIYELLLQRPRTPEELLIPLDFLSAMFLPLQRLEESGLIQRCGLTPTDLLHVKGEFSKWDTSPAQQMLNIMAELSQKPVKVLLDELLTRMEKDLSLELLKKQMSREFTIADMEKTPMFHELLKQIIQPENKRYAITAKFNHPIVGIGAPVHFFLPQAGKRLNAEVVIPQDADVANALGAVTSHIMIKRKLSIKANDSGKFIVEGVVGNRQFSDIVQAEQWALTYLKEHVRELGRSAGTSRKTVAMEIKDRVASTNSGTPLFLDRSIMATLSGSPDIVVNAVYA